MPLHVFFQTPATVGRGEAASVGTPARQEVIADSATGSLVALDGEMAVICNPGAASVYVAHGKVPSTSATAATGDTSARYTLPPNQMIQVAVKTGDKFAVAALA